jgi:hypothetical protein
MVSLRSGFLGIFLALASSASAFAIDPIVAIKFAEEKGCTFRATKVAQANCLDGIADWWFSEAVMYDIGSYDPIREAHRIIGESSRLDPMNLDRLTNLLWLQFSVDVNAVQDGAATDITQTAIELVESYSAFYPNRFEYPFLVTDQLLLFVQPRGVGSKEMKLIYMSYAEKIHAQARALYPAFSSRLSADQKQQIEFQLGVIDRALVKRRAQLEALP